MMSVDFLPEHLVVIGGSYIGLEFAQMYRRFGSQVTVVEQGPRLIGREDHAVLSMRRAPKQHSKSDKITHTNPR
jgi:pyruvate/2-oxoglutarate dehydrogenase complex dihydrolipoamide dehydrogenase (E3) component